MKNLLIITLLFLATLAKGQEFKFNEFIQVNDGSNYANHPVEINIKSDSKIKYNFSHSVLTNGKSYDEFVKQNNGKVRLTITPRILDQIYVDSDNVLIISNSGLYLFKVSKNELTLLKESEFDSNGKLVSYFTEVIKINGDTVKLKLNKVVPDDTASTYYSTSFKSDKERSDSLSKLNGTAMVTFIIDTTNKTLVNL